MLEINYNRKQCISQYYYTCYADHTYFGLQVGRADPSGNLSKLVYTEHQTDTTVPTEKTGGWQLGMKLGYQHEINRIFSLGVESGFQHFNKFAKFGHPSAIPYFTYSMNSVPFFIVGDFYLPTTVNVVKNLNFFIKGGYSYNDLKLTFHSDPNARFPDSTYSKHSFNPVATVGIGYTYHQFNIFAEYQINWVSVGKKGIGEPTVNNTNGRLGTASVGVAYLL